MNAAQLDGLIKSLGQRRDQISIEGLDIQVPRVERYTAGEWMDIDVEAGVVMEFRVETQIFEALYIRFLDDESDDFEYSGELPAPFKSEMFQSDVRKLFGVPDESQGAINIPEPIGLVGGWDVYSMRPDAYPKVQVFFRYLETLEVYGLSFKHVYGVV